MKKILSILVVLCSFTVLAVESPVCAKIGTRSVGGYSFDMRNYRVLSWDLCSEN